MNYILMFHIDKYGDKGIVLYQTSNLSEMDNYIINNFSTRQNLFLKYQDDISEFCLDNRDFIKYENEKNSRNRLGAITLFCKYKNNYGEYKIKIPIIYGNDNKLLSNNLCLKNIKNKLTDNLVLIKILADKNYLLSSYEKSLISSYIKFKDIKTRDYFIKIFINRIEKFTDEKKYFFFRCLMNLCSLNEIKLKTSKGDVSNINTNISSKTTITHENNFLKIEDDNIDHYLVNLIEQENYENINKYYDMDKIQKYRNLYKKK